MRSFAHIGLVCSLVLAACSSEGGAPPFAPAAAAQTTPPLDAQAAPAPPNIVGAWTSAACGARTYERRLSFAADGSFTAEDRVSPCPRGVDCIWSGIVIRHGKFAVSSDAIQLVVEGPNAGPGQPLPGSLAIGATGAPVEVGADGERCAYRPSR